MTGAAHAGFVLAGGRSSRMGTDKALLLLDGQTLLERTARVVEAAAGSVVIVGDPLKYSHLPYPVIADAHRNAGPLAGIEAALRHTASDWNLIVACDMPGLDRAFLARLLGEGERTPHADVLLAEGADGGPQPLCAAYHRRVLPAIEAALARGCFKIMDALQGMRVLRVAGRERSWFLNINTPADWDAFTGG